MTTVRKSGAKANSLRGVEMETNIEDIINAERWRFAITYAKTSPHEYIVRGRCSDVRNFDCLCEYIKNNGHYEYFFNHRYTYCSIGAFTYWVMGDVINRRWNDIYYVNEKKQVCMVEDWEEKLNDGRILHK